MAKLQNVHHIFHLIYIYIYIYIYISIHNIHMVTLDLSKYPTSEPRPEVVGVWDLAQETCGDGSASVEFDSKQYFVAGNIMKHVFISHYIPKVQRGKCSRDIANLSQRKRPMSRWNFRVSLQTIEDTWSAKVCFHNTMVDRITSQREGCGSALFIPKFQGLFIHVFILVGRPCMHLTSYNLCIHSI